jgi:integrase
MKPIKRISSKGAVTYRIFVENKITKKKESRVFSSRQYAIAWAEKRKDEIERESIFGKKDESTVGDLIVAYLDMFVKDHQRTKLVEIKNLLNHDVAKIKVLDLTPRDLINHCLIRGETVRPQTANRDIVWLKKVLETMCVMNNLEFDYGVFVKANVMMKCEQLVAPVGKRSRVATWQELLKLTRYFRSLGSSIPFVDMMWFSAFSARRLSETTRIKWSDNDNVNQTGMVEDVKHPTKKKGNDMRFKYEKSAWKIIQRQPKVDERIFPYHPRTVSNYFVAATRACKIKDLHWHDLRRTAVTRLFMKGYTVEQVMLFSLHTQLSTLQIYMALKPEDVVDR